MLRILLADDHAVVRKGIRDFLQENHEVTEVTEASDGAEAWRLLTAAAADNAYPDVAVLDLRMPELNGIELTQRIKAQYPQVRVLILSAYDDDPYVLTALRAGADGYLLKTAPAADLVRAVQQVAAGQRVLDPELAAKLIANLSESQTFEPLSERELAVVRGVARGWSNREIGRALSISERTVQGHLVSVFKKLHVNSRTELVTVALQHDLIKLDERQP